MMLGYLYVCLDINLSVQALSVAMSFAPALTTIFTPPASCLDNSYTAVGGANYV
jgi:hypothetical protein